MDETRFDRLTCALAGDGGTRRTLLGVAGGGLAALFGGVLGDGPFGAIEADAKRRRRRRRRKKQRTQATQNNQDNGVTINLGDTNLLPSGGALSSITNLNDLLGDLGLPDAAALITRLTDEGVANAATVVANIATQGLVCVPTSRTILSLCATGNCETTNNTCADCPEDRECGGGNTDNLLGEVCCVEGFICADVGCVVDGLG